MEYLDSTDREQYVAENLFMNAQQILAQYEVKEQFRKETSLWFRPFTMLAGILAVIFFDDYFSCSPRPLHKKTKRTFVQG